MIDSLKIFQETGTGGVLKTGDGIRAKSGTPPLSTDKFTITFPVAFYTTKEQEDARLVREVKAVRELAYLIKKLK